MNYKEYLNIAGSHHIPLIVIVASTALAIAVSVYSLMAGWLIIFQNLFYIPIIIACAYYVKRGFVFSVILTCTYCALMLYFVPNPEVLQGAAIRVLIFILVAGVITYLSLIRQQTEEALRDSERKLATIIDFLPDATFAINPDGQVIAWNRAMETLTDTGGQEILGKGNYEPAYRLLGERRPLLVNAVLQSDADILEKWYPTVRKDGLTLSGEFELPSLHGKRVVLWVIAAPLFNSHGELIGAIESIRDITRTHDNGVQLKRVNESLTEANEKLNLLNKITRHDMLNTIHTLLGYIELVRQTVPENQPSLIYISEVDTLVHQLWEQVEFTRDYQDIGIQAPVWQGIQKTIERAVKNINTGSVTILIDTDSLEIFADPLLEKVFYNLATNAILHGARTKRIVFSTEERGAGRVIVCEDDGVGVPEQIKEAIFKREYYKNTGLGMSLSCNILSITGLSITETGVPGRGARFEIFVPEGLYRQITDE